LVSNFFYDYFYIFYIFLYFFYIFLYFFYIFLYFFYIFLYFFIIFYIYIKTMVIVGVSYPETGIENMWEVRSLLKEIVAAVQSHPDGIRRLVEDYSVAPKVKRLDTEIERIDYNLNLIMNHINNPSISGSLKLMNKYTFNKLLESKARAKEGTILREKNQNMEMQKDNAALKVLKDKERKADAEAEAEAETKREAAGEAIRQAQLDENPQLKPTPELEPEPEPEPKSKNSQGWSFFGRGGTKRISSKRKTTRRRRRR
jgi:hypothetical protein